jgi:hypothetical protein
MTVTEFARKYKIPQSTVYNASFRIPFEQRKEYNNNYPVDELIRVTKEELKGRIEYHQQRVDTNSAYLQTLLKEV